MNKAKSALDLAQTPGQARQGPVRGQGRSAEGLSAEPGHPDPGAERSALVADGAGSGAQQTAHSRPDRRGHRRPSRKRAASIRRPPSSRRSPAPWSSARSAPANTSTPAPAIRSIVIGDLSTVWLTAFVRETDAAARRGRAGDDLQRAGAAGPVADRPHQLCRDRDRSRHAPAAGPRHHRQYGRRS